MYMPEKLAELRRQKGLSQIELAEAMSVSRQAVSMWESGATIPSIDNLILLSRLYGVSVDEILGAVPPEKAADASAENQPEGRSIRGRLYIAVALVLAALIMSVSAFLIWGDDSNAELMHIEDMQEEVIPDIDDLNSVPWESI